MLSLENVKLADKGCYSHPSRKHILMNFQEFDEPENVALGDSCVVKALGS